MSDLETALAEVFDGETGEETEAVQETPVAAEPEAPAEPDTPTEEAAPEPEEEQLKLFAGKYKSAEDLEKAYEALQAKMGEQGTEVGDLRKQLEDFQSQFEALRQSQPAPPPPTGQPDWLDETALENPAVARQTALWAAEHQPHQFQRVLSTWFDVDPQAASEFQAEVSAAQVRAEMDEKYGPLLEVPKRFEAEDSARQRDASINTALASVKASNPDFDELADDLKVAIDTNPAMARVLDLGDPEAVEQTLNLYLEAARGRRQRAEQIAAAESQEAADAAVSKAKVTRATSSAGNSKPKTPNDAFLEFWDEKVAPRQGIGLGG